MPKDSRCIEVSLSSMAPLTLLRRKASTQAGAPMWATHAHTSSTLHCTSASSDDADTERPRDWLSWYEFFRAPRSDDVFLNVDGRAWVSVGPSPGSTSVHTRSSEAEELRMITTAWRVINTVHEANKIKSVTYV